MTDEYYIMSRTIVGNCATWWGKNRCGYVCDLREAGKYTKEEAVKQEHSRPGIDFSIPSHVAMDAMVMHVRADDTLRWHRENSAV